MPGTQPVIARLTWNDSVGAPRYAVSVATAAGGPFRIVGSTDATDYEFKDGLGGVPYYFRVAAINDQGEESLPAPAPVGPVTSSWVSDPHAPATSKTNKCGSCHVPHQALASPLMRTEISTDTPGQTATCLTCHDGKIESAADVAWGTRDSFGLVSGHTLGTSGSAGGLTRGCASCHDPHATSAKNPMMPQATINGVPVPSNGNAWCLTCHDNNNSWYSNPSTYPVSSAPLRDAAGYPVLGAWLGKSTFNGSANAHRLLPETTQTAGSGKAVRRGAGDCLYCHAAHRGANAYDGLVAAFRPTTQSTLVADKTQGDYAAVCFTCHGGLTPSGFATAPVDIKRLVTSGGQTAGHSIVTSGGLLPLGSPLPCYECHNPHGSKRGNDSMISDVLGASLSTTGSPSAIRRFCFTCHTTSGTAKGWDSTTATYTVVTVSARVVGIPRTGGVLNLPNISGHGQTDALSCYVCHGADYGAGGSNVHSPGAGGYEVEIHTGAPVAAAYTINGTTYPVGPCSECHSTELGPEHFKASSSSSAAECGACHPMPRDTLSPWSKISCAEGGCHTPGSTAPQHDGIDAAHAFVQPFGCGGTGCHNGDAASVHSVASTTVAGDTRTSCLVCHADGVPASTDCRVCHDQGAPHGDEAAIHGATLGAGEVMMGAGPGDSDHGSGWSTVVECSMCHYANLVVQHGNKCTTCHSGANPAGSLGTWDKTCQQGDCHPSIHTGMTPDHNSSRSCDSCHTGYPDWPGDVDCTRCHAASDTIPDTIAPTTGSDVTSSYTGAATIHLTADDNFGGSGADRTYYILDGGAENQGTTVSVAAPSAGSQSHTLQFYSVDRAGNSEGTTPVPPFSFTVMAVPDTTPPSGTMSVNNGAAYAISTAVTLNSAVSDAGSGLYQMSVDPGSGTFGSWIAYSASSAIILPTGDGTKTVRVRYTDNASNVATLTDTILLDTTPPTTTSNSVASYIGVANITLTATDGVGGSGVATTHYRIDSGPQQSGTSIIIAPPSSGSVSHTIYFWSVDNATKTEAEKSDTFTINALASDTTSPTTTSSFNPALGAIYNSARPVTLTAIDIGGSGVKATYYRVDGGSYTAGTSLSITGDGLHTFNYYSADNADNTETVQASNQFRIDTVPPVTTSNIAAGTTYTGAQMFALTPLDTNGSGVADTWWQLDSTSGAWTSGTSIPVTAPSVGSVSHTLYWYSNDNATNPEATESVTFSVAAPAGTGTTTISFRTNASLGGWSYVYWEVLDANGNSIPRLHVLQ